MGFWSFMAHRGVAIVLAILTFILGWMAIMGTAMKPLLAGSTILNVVLWVLAIGCGIASAYFFKTQH